MGISPKIKRYVVRILVLTFIVSVGLNLYDHFVVLPQMQATINNMSLQALDGWMGKMETVRNILKRAETNIDVEDGHVHTSWAERFVDILTTEMESSKYHNKLYYSMSKATFYLDEALLTVHFGNQTEPVTERNLDENVLTMIENVTTNIENLYNKINLVRTRPPNGVEPTQQLREAGVLTDVLTCLEQIYQVSSDILNYYK